MSTCALCFTFLSEWQSYMIDQAFLEVPAMPPRDKLGWGVPDLKFPHFRMVRGGRTSDDDSHPDMASNEPVITLWKCTLYNSKN